MGGLPDLRQLLWVAEHDDAARRQSRGGRVGERELPGLVDEQQVEAVAVLLAREQPRGAGQERVLVALGLGVPVDAVDEVPDRKTSGATNGIPSVRPRIAAGGQTDS
jgi:hypothetical protein